MTKLQITTALGAALLVVSCEPILVHPSEQDAAARDGSGQDTAGPSKSPDIRDKSRRDKARRGPWIRGSGYPVESEGFQPEAQRQLEAESRPIRDEYPVAVRTGDRDRVISPYSPYNVIDVKGFRSGQLAKDPSNRKIFRIP